MLSKVSISARGQYLTHWWQRAWPGGSCAHQKWSTMDTVWRDSCDGTTTTYYKEAVEGKSRSRPGKAVMKQSRHPALFSAPVMIGKWCRPLPTRQRKAIYLPPPFCLPCTLRSPNTQGSYSTVCCLSCFLFLPFPAPCFIWTVHFLFYLYFCCS